MKNRGRHIHIIRSGEGLAVRVRTAEEQDAEAACHVLRQSIQELCVADHGNDARLLEGWLANKTPENVRTWIETPDVTFMVAERDQVIIGVGAVTADGHIVLNYVSPKARFQGVSKAVLVAMEEHLRQQGCDFSRLHSSLTAHRFYQSAGYRDDGEAQRRGDRSSQPMIKKL